MGKEKKHFFAVSGDKFSVSIQILQKETPFWSLVEGNSCKTKRGIAKLVC